VLIANARVFQQHHLDRWRKSSIRTCQQPIGCQEGEYKHQGQPSSLNYLENDTSGTAETEALPLNLKSQRANQLAQLFACVTLALVTIHGVPIALTIGYRRYGNAQEHATIRLQKSKHFTQRRRIVRNVFETLRRDDQVSRTIGQLHGLRCPFAQNNICVGPLYTIDVVAVVLLRLNAVGCVRTFAVP
jgi:hypothetical protein